MVSCHVCARLNDAFLYVSSLDIDMCFVHYLKINFGYIDIDISFYGYDRLMNAFC
jgi:hypothetical protein